MYTKSGKLLDFWVPVTFSSICWSRPQRVLANFLNSFLILRIIPGFAYKKVSHRWSAVVSEGTRTPAWPNLVSPGTFCGPDICFGKIFLYLFSFCISFQVLLQDGLLPLASSGQRRDSDTSVTKPRGFEQSISGPVVTYTRSLTTVLKHLSSLIERKGQVRITLFHIFKILIQNHSIEYQSTVVCPPKKLQSDFQHQ